MVYSKVGFYLEIIFSKCSDRLLHLGFHLFENYGIDLPSTYNLRQLCEECIPI